MPDRRLPRERPLPEKAHLGRLPDRPRRLPQFILSLSLCALIALSVGPRCAYALDVAGHWAGRMEPTNLSAELELTIQPSGDSWTAELTFRAGPDGGPLPIEAIQVDGDHVVVRTKIEGADVTLELSREDDLLLGSVHVMENGRILAEGPAGLARASDPGAKTRLIGWLDAQGTSIDAPRRGVVIARACELLKSNYLFEDRAEHAAADVAARALRGEYDPISSPARLAELLGRHLSEATGDRHVQVKFGAARVSDPLADAEETKEQRAWLRREAEAEGFGIGRTRVLDGNVGYVEFKRFFRPEYAGDAFAAAMKQVESTDALIVDLRETRGGDPLMVVLAASWFFEGRPRHWNDMVRRRDGTTTQFWTAAWLPATRYVDKPVYVLTAHRTFSAPESFAYELQQTRRATIVGEVTGGGAHSGSWFPIDDRFSIFVPLSRYVSATSGGDWEGTGVTPDVVCGAPEALERAHTLALEHRKRK